MELNRTRRWFYLLTLLWVVMLLSLGSWWLYLVFKLHTTLTSLHLPELGTQERFLNMMKWEGSFFFIFLVLLGASLLYMYFRDMKKTKSMQAFFASLTHELKTPLASMRLQAEVIKDMASDPSTSHNQFEALTTRLIEDTYKLEAELEKSLQLSRVEQDGNLTLNPLSLDRYLKRYQQKVLKDLTFDISLQAGAEEIQTDELALNVIFRNLIENTIRHNPKSKIISIRSIRLGDMIELTYDDHGVVFSGNSSKLGELFYKFNSSKGTGIGLYLIKNLMRKMGGQLLIDNKDSLRFKLLFRSIKEQRNV